MHITQTIFLSLNFLWEACSDESGPKPHQAHLKVGFFWRAQGIHFEKDLGLILTGA